MADSTPTGSKPVLVQNVLSSTDVTASIRIGGIWSKVMTCRLSPLEKRASSTVPVRS